MNLLSPEEKWQIKRFLASTYVDYWKHSAAGPGTHFEIRVAIKTLAPVLAKYNLSLEELLCILEEDIIPRLKG